ncbi:MAG TPA: UbiH/UbiF family hydroxylase [Burkholderiales bacterium]|nr:UbiH/UbiF family hydroxylase [Burkholderiales bacterium]
MDFDIVIVGGGLAGASLAAALADTRQRVALVERKAPPVPRPEWDARVYTLTPASIAFLERIGAWQRVSSERITPIYDMHVAGDDGSSRLDFSAYESGLLRLGATVESGRLQRALWDGLERQSNLALLCPASPAALHRSAGRVDIGLEGGRTARARLVVGADGGDSWVRRAAGIDARSESYDQLGVVANFVCAREHRGIAYQWFLRDGVLAFLPLPERRVSIVWSTSRAHARELLALAPDALCARVGQASAGVLGDLQALTPPAAFPLSRMAPRRIAQERVALVGDSAHVVHPLAGQGINLGLGDAHCLAGLLAGAPDPGDSILLRRFERSRAEDILALHWITHGLFRLFGTNHAMIRRIRNLGLNLTNSNPVIKTLLTRRATAVGGGLHQRETP